MEHPSVIVPEKAVSGRDIFRGKIINVREDTVELPNGASAIREVVEHSGGVGVLALDDADNVLMVRQFRYAIGRESLEIPAGKREKGEDPRVCGIRELEEETGYVASEFTDFGSLDPTPAYCTEVIHLFLAKGLTYRSQRLDEDEFLAVERVPLAEAVEMCRDGRITDAKTLVAILKYHSMQ
ncbi:NUDIX hydrolase [Ruminococcaceae bacterium OttesenSCG-928-L11]|nr:NUDIX hydrolase [Ruminococcaceae bacterium OttesenSCG-928-L11]